MADLVDSPPLAPEEPDDADRHRLLPLELLAWDGGGRLVGVRCTGGSVVLRSGRPPSRRSLDITRVTRWARAGRVTLHCAEGSPSGSAAGSAVGSTAASAELRLLAPVEYAGRSVGDTREVRVAGPLRMARAGQRSDQRGEVARVLVARVLAVFPEAQVSNG